MTGADAVATDLVPNYRRRQPFLEDFPCRGHLRRLARATSVQCFGIISRPAHAAEHRGYMTRIEGSLSRWNDDRGFGFITPRQGGSDVFVHVSAFPRDGRRPCIGEPLSFEVVTDPRGKRTGRTGRLIQLPLRWPNSLQSDDFMRGSHLLPAQLSRCEDGWEPRRHALRGTVVRWSVKPTSPPHDGCRRPNPLRRGAKHCVQERSPGNQERLNLDQVPGRADGKTRKICPTVPFFLTAGNIRIRCNDRLRST